MKTKNLILTTMMILFTIGMTGCDKDNDRLFDVDEPIGEPEKELTEEEKEMEKRYPLRLIDYLYNLANDIIHLVEEQSELGNMGNNISNLPNPLPVVDFFKNNHNLRGFIYRGDMGASNHDRLEKLIAYLIDDFENNKDSYVGILLTKKDNHINYRIYLGKADKDTYIRNIVLLEAWKDLDNNLYGISDYRISYTGNDK